MNLWFSFWVQTKDSSFFVIKTKIIIQKLKKQKQNVRFLDFYWSTGDSKIIKILKLKKYCNKKTTILWYINKKIKEKINEKKNID